MESPNEGLVAGDLSEERRRIEEARDPVKIVDVGVRQRTRQEISVGGAIVRKRLRLAYIGSKAPRNGSVPQAPPGSSKDRRISARSLYRFIGGELVLDDHPRLYTDTAQTLM
jgi:hypothetical protein